MNKPSQIIFNFIVFFFLLLTAIVLQTSLFHWIITWRSTIQIALVLMTYICLYRGPLEALLFTLLGSYCLGLTSTMLQSVSIFSGMCMFIATQVVKNQIYSSSPVQFTWVALSNIFFFHVVSWVVSSIFEGPPQLRPLDWILEILITALFTKILFAFFIFVDQKTKRIEVSELER
jgi:hypothetical protein